MVAISYYMIGIVTKLIEGLGSYVPTLDTKLLSLLSIPVVVLVVWLGVRRLRHSILKDGKA